jgi:hypothetical protein
MVRNLGQVQVARIAAWQAIVVAAITAAGGALAGYFAKPGSSLPDTSLHQFAEQHYLIIRGIDASPGQMVRVVARINNVLYAYPADVTFTPVTPAMPEQKLPLPLSEGKYIVSFEAQLMGHRCDEVSLARSRETPHFDATALPSEVQSYQLLRVDAGGAYGVPALTVRYSFQ